jgi:hypothetical protein
MGQKFKAGSLPAALVYQDTFIQFGDTLYNVVATSKFIDTQKGILSSPPRGGFSSYEPQTLIENLDWILALTRLKKDPKHFAFTQIDTKGNGYYLFSINRDAFDALDTSLYALGQLVDEISKETYPNELRIVKKKFQDLLRLFDL